MNKKKIILGVVVVVAAAAIGIGIYAANKLNKIEKTELPKETLEVSKEVEEELEDEYENIAVFGVNAKSPKDDTLDSDLIMVVSINKNTKAVNLVSVYGNTALVSDDGKKVRAKDVYAKGGAKAGVALLNRNLDLDIEKYVTVNFQAMVAVIDILDGIEIDVAEDEIPHIDGYDAGIAKIVGKKATPLKKAGKQVLNGTQATGYCRIRITDGGDVKRGNRQKEVVDQIMAKLKEAKFSQMDKIMDEVFPMVETNFTNAELISYGKDAAAYTLAPIQNFPAEMKAQKRTAEGEDYEERVEAKDYAAEVSALHQQLFPNASYSGSERVQENGEILK